MLGKQAAKPDGLSHSPQMIRMKFDLMLKQFKLNIVLPLLSEKYVINTNSCFTISSMNAEIVYVDMCSDIFEQFI